MKFVKLLQAILLILIFLALGINKVAYLFFQSVDLTYLAPLAITFFDGIFEIRIFETSIRLDIGYIAEISSERIKSILSSRN